MKAMDATWIDALMRFKQGGYHPKRTISVRSVFVGRDFLTDLIKLYADAQYP
jgi:hypothetical protein